MMSDINMLQIYRRTTSEALEKVPSRKLSGASHLIGNFAARSARAVPVTARDSPKSAIFICPSSDIHILIIDKYWEKNAQTSNENIACCQVAMNDVCFVVQIRHAVCNFKRHSKQCCAVCETHKRSKPTSTS